VEWQRLAVKATALLLVAVASLCPAGEPGKADPSKEDKQVVDTKAAKRPSATSVDFRKELNLPFQSLGTLGGRIESARRASDPVALGHAASELAVAEKVSGKKASLTSTALVKESAQLAKLRRQTAELQATLTIANQVANEEALATELKNEIAQAQKFTKQETAAAQRNEEPTGPRNLLVNNYTPQYVDVFVNGYYKMQVLPGESQQGVIEHKWNPTVLKASGNDDITYWGPRYIWGTFKTYTWNLH
jgi:hypothetical protein